MLRRAPATWLAAWLPPRRPPAMARDRLSVRRRTLGCGLSTGNSVPGADPSAVGAAATAGDRLAGAGAVRNAVGLPRPRSGASHSLAAAAQNGTILTIQDAVQYAIWMTLD